jgi:hypothetical protein
MFLLHGEFHKPQKSEYKKTEGTTKQMHVLRRFSFLFFFSAPCPLALGPWFLFAFLGSWRCLQSSCALLTQLHCTYHALTQRGQQVYPPRTTNQGPRKKWPGTFCWPFWKEGVIWHVALMAFGNFWFMCFYLLHAAWPYMICDMYHIAGIYGSI